MRVMLWLALGAGEAMAAAPAPDPAAGFAQYYRQAFADLPAPRVAQAADGRGATALVELAGRRGLGALCHGEQQRFARDGAWGGARGWRLTGTRQLAWLTRSAGCAASPSAVRMLAPMADVDLIPLLEQAAPLLARARLLLAGNSACAPMRSYPFSLSAVGTGAPAGKAELMYELHFDSDRDGVATVWVRKRGAELAACDVACAGRGPGE
ncbi:MAG: hypothetical protein ABIT83_06975 [Massilia sp.]